MSLTNDALVETPKASLGDRMQLGALRGLVSVLRALKWKRAVAIGEKVGSFGYRPFGVRRRTVERQIAAAFPEMTREQVQETAREAYAHLGRMTIEAALLSDLGREGVLSLFDGADGWEHVERAHAQGKGIIFATGHVGNWELAGAYVSAHYPSNVIVRKMSNPLFDRWINETRARLGMHVVYDSQAVRRVPRSLRENRAIGFLADQGVKGLASTFVPFFGRPAKTPRGPAVFALRFGSPVVFGAAIRQPNGRYRFVAEPVTVEQTGDRERDVDAIVARYTKILEETVRRTPGQYFWHHRRWRRQPKDTPPELREP